MRIKRVSLVTALATIGLVLLCAGLVLLFARYQGLLHTNEQEASEKAHAAVESQQRVRETATIAEVARTTELHVGDDAPELTVSRWVKGEPVRSFEKGHVYVLDFWATWCVPCKESMPHMSELARQYAGKTTFIAMDVAEIPKPGQDLNALIDDFVQKMGDKMDLRVAMDTADGSVNESWLKAAGQRSLPSVFIVDADGKVAWIGKPKEVDEPLAKIVDASRGGAQEGAHELIGSHVPAEQEKLLKKYQAAVAEAR